jgi:hypothetical protein
MEIIDDTDTMLRIHHLPYVPRTLWFIGMILGTVGVAVLIWTAMHNSHPAFVILGGVLTTFGLWSMLTDERHIMWAFNKEEGLLTVRYDARSREIVKQYQLHDIRDAVLATRPSHRHEKGDTFRSEVVLRFRNGERDIALPMTHDTADWQEKREIMFRINQWLQTPTATWQPSHTNWRSVFDEQPALSDVRPATSRALSDIKISDF